MHPDGDVALGRLQPMYTTFMLAVVGYVLAAVALTAMDVEIVFTQLGDSSTLWVMRVLLAILSAVGLSVADRIPLRLPDSPEMQDQWLTETSPRVQQAFLRAVIRIAFTESIGIHGLVLFLIGGHFADLLSFCAVSLVVFAWRFPTRDRWASELAGISSTDAALAGRPRN